VRLRREVVHGRVEPLTGGAVELTLKRKTCGSLFVVLDTAQVRLRRGASGRRAARGCSAHLICIPEIARAITSCWISAVPSKMS
jgi:hypothetical protein